MEQKLKIKNKFLNECKNLIVTSRHNFDLEELESLIVYKDQLLMLQFIGRLKHNCDEIEINFIKDEYLLMCRQMAKKLSHN